MPLLCRGASVKTLHPEDLRIRQRRKKEEAERNQVIFRESFVVTGHPPPILGWSNSQNQEGDLGYLRKVRNSLRTLDTDVLMHLFGDQAYIERSNCAERTNEFIGRTKYSRRVGFIVQDDDLRGEENRARNRRYLIMAKLSHLITVGERELSSHLQLPSSRDRPPKRK